MSTTTEIVPKTEEVPVSYFLTAHVCQVERNLQILRCLSANITGLPPAFCSPLRPPSTLPEREKKKRSDFGQALERDSLNITKRGMLAGDDAVPRRTGLLKPFSVRSPDRNSEDLQLPTPTSPPGSRKRVRLTRFPVQILPKTHANVHRHNELISGPNYERAPQLAAEGIWSEGCQSSCCRGLESGSCDPGRHEHLRSRQS